MSVEINNHVVAHHGNAACKRHMQDCRPAIPTQQPNSFIIHPPNLSSILYIFTGGFLLDITLPSIFLQYRDPHTWSSSPQTHAAPSGALLGHFGKSLRVGKEVASGFQGKVLADDPPAPDLRDEVTALRRRVAVFGSELSAMIDI